MLDLSLVGLNVNDENKCVAVFDELHGRLGGKWVLDDGVCVDLILLRCALSLILWLSCWFQGLWLVEVNLGVDACSLLGNSLL